MNEKQIGEEEMREAAWNLCKQFDAGGRRRDRVILSNFVSIELEEQFGFEIENDYRAQAQEEVGMFCLKYGYAGAPALHTASAGRHGVDYSNTERSRQWNKR